MGETESDQGPVDFGSGERARHGRCAPVFRAKRDRVAMKAQERRGKHDSIDGEMEEVEQCREQPPSGRRFVRRPEEY